MEQVGSKFGNIETLCRPTLAGGFPSSEYHLYFQSTDPGQSLGSVWGHAGWTISSDVIFCLHIQAISLPYPVLLLTHALLVSEDLVRWRRLNRTGVKGSSGGGIALPPNAPTRDNPVTAHWKAGNYNTEVNVRFQH